MPDDTPDASPPKKSPLSYNVGRQELGRTGLKQYSGNLYEEFLPALQGQRGVRVYNEMLNNSPIVGSMLFAIEALLRSVDWEVEPISDDESDMETAEFVAQNMDDMENSWEDFISEVLSMLPFGWSYFEMVFKRRKGIKSKTDTSQFDDGRIGWKKFGFRAQESLFHWDFGPHGEIKGMWQYPVPGAPFDNSASTVFLPMNKCMLFRTTSHKNNPEGKSVLRTAYRPWYISKSIEEFEAIGIERDLAGMPIAKVPISLLSSDRTDQETQTYNYIKDIVTRVKMDQQMGIIWPNEYDDQNNKVFEFDLISAPARRAADTGGIIQRYMQQMAMTVMADFILLGHENVGSFALSSDKTELFSVALGSWLDSIAEIINRQAVRPLIDLNGFNTERGYPRVVHGDIETPDLQMLGAYVQQLAASGVPLFPDLTLENALRQAADLPLADPEEREQILSQQAEMMAAQQAGPFEMPGSNGGPSSNGQPASKKPSFNAVPEGDAPAKVAKGVRLQNRYYDGQKWKIVRGRHRFKK